MTIRYVGAGGNDGGAGTTWATRKLTLNGVEDTPVVAGDIVRVGPGVYRETLTCDVSGSSGNIITYIADVTGENTDGVGGEVRITGSNDDQDGDRTTVINLNGAAYRTFRGFRMDTPSGSNNSVITFSGAEDNIIVEDSVVAGATYAWGRCATVNNATNITFRRNIFAGVYYGIHNNPGTTYDNRNILIENCVFIGCYYNYYGGVGGAVIKNCLFFGGYAGIDVALALTAGQDVQAYNNILQNVRYSFRCVTTDDLIEDYNVYWGSDTPHTNLTAGTNTVFWNPNLDMPLLLATLKLPSGFILGLSQWSQVRAKTGSSPASDDLFGMDRPATGSKISWGPIQYPPMIRDTATTRGSSAAALELSDAGRVQFRIPVTDASTTVSVYVYREANYAGTAPQMIIRQPGQSARTTTDAAAASQWNELTDTFTPAATPGYVIVELVSNNTATSGSFAVYFEDLTVS